MKKKMFVADDDGFFHPEGFRIHASREELLRPPTPP